MTLESAGDPACTYEPPTVASGGPLSHALYRVARLHRTVAAKLLRRTGLYPGQELLMMRLWDAPAARQAELIKAMGLDPSTVTKMLQRLESAGHVKRFPDPADRRASLVEATPASCALRTEVAETWTELERHTLKGLDATERAELARLLAKVERNLCTEAAPAPDAAPGAPSPGSGSGPALGSGAGPAC
ncbi:MarR family winged helix-turn-helix transcriptional regulator [Streptomyces sp. NPDC093085]|uniref:MarR family winged helix-turn-helix transcriptional regulator n=1 Tax=Streptomyces sp. NPDC093085 TaxID=3155068 RepID=UPI003437E41B